jgi:hypothetical protein
MSIQIIDNFYLNSSKPIDNRFVVGPQSFYTHRDLIDWKYVGMRVWDLNDGVNGMPYVWTGTTYSSENSVSIGGSGTVNQLPKFVTSTTVGDSNIYDDGTNVGISNLTPAYKLDVTGSIKASANLYGAASDPITGAQTITNINADAITGGTLLLNRLQNSSNNDWILTSGNPAGSGQATWLNPLSLTVGNALVASNAVSSTNTTNVNITSYSVSGTSYLLFANATGNTSVYTNLTWAPKINPSNGRLTLGNSTQLTDQLRITAQSSGNFHPFSVGYSTGYNNFRIITSSSGTSIHLHRYPSSGASQSSTWTSFGGVSPYDGISFAGRTYLNVDGSGTSDSRLITFGGGGTNDQFRFYMIGNSSTVPVLAGYGAYVERNLYVNGTFSAANVRLINSGVEAVTPQFALSIGTAQQRYVTNTGLQSGLYQHVATAYDRYITLTLGGTANTQEVRFLCAVEVGEGTGSYQTVERRKGQDGYTAISFLVAAKCRFQIQIDNIGIGTLTADCSVSSRRFGFV